MYIITSERLQVNANAQLRDILNITENGKISVESAKYENNSG